MGKIGEVHISLGGNLPPESRCGLPTVYDDMVRQPARIRFAVIAYDVGSSKIDTDSGEVEPVCRIKRWECCTGTDEQAALDMLDRLNNLRTDDGGPHQPSLATVSEISGHPGDPDGGDQDSDRVDDPDSAGVAGLGPGTAGGRETGGGL